MSPQRARELLDLRTTIGNVSMRIIDCGDIREHMTDAENAAVLAKWRQMPGWTCYADALGRIARDAA